MGCQRNDVSLYSVSRRRPPEIHSSHYCKSRVFKSGSVVMGTVLWDRPIHSTEVSGRTKVALEM